MDRHDFQTKYAGHYIDNNGTQIVFNSLHSFEDGTMTTFKSNGQTVAGSYKLREENGLLYLGWRGEEYLLRPTEKGFDLLIGKTTKYSYTRID